jgi:hypothetical protein
VLAYGRVATNQIREVTFRPVAPSDSGDSEGGHALFMALEVGEPARLLGFLEEVVARFKRERMAGPPDARFMLITVVGEVSAEDFVQVWQASIVEDAPARALLGTMHQADVMQGDAQGRMLGLASLLASEEPSDEGERSRDGGRGGPSAARRE